MTPWELAGWERAQFNFELEVSLVVDWGSGEGATFVPTNYLVTPTEVELGCVGL